MEHVELLIIVTNTVTLVFGTTITLLAYRACRRTGQGPLRTLAVGLGLVTLGALLGGITHQLADLPITLGIAVHSTFTAVGFTALAYSLLPNSAPSSAEPEVTRRIQRTEE